MWSHVAPRKDLKPHVTGHGVTECWCQPRIERTKTYVLVAHNSMDGRELIEAHGVQ